MQEANRMMYANEYFGIMMVEMGDADAFVSGYATKYSVITSYSIHYTKLYDSEYFFDLIPKVPDTIIEGKSNRSLGGFCRRLGEFSENENGDSTRSFVE